MAFYNFQYQGQQPDSSGPTPPLPGVYRPAAPQAETQQALATNYLSGSSSPSITANPGAQATSSSNFFHQMGVGIHSYVDAAGQWLHDHLSDAQNPGSFDDDLKAARARLEAPAAGPIKISVAGGAGHYADSGTLSAAVHPTPGNGSAFGNPALQAMSQILDADPATVQAAHDNFLHLTGRAPNMTDLMSLKAQGQLGPLAQGAPIDYKEAPADDWLLSYGRRLAGATNTGLVAQSSGYGDTLSRAMAAVPGLHLPYAAHQVISNQLFNPATTVQGVANLLRAGVSPQNIRAMAAAVGGATGQNIAAYIPQQ